MRYIQIFAMVACLVPINVLFASLDKVQFIEHGKDYIPYDSEQDKTIIMDFIHELHVQELAIKADRIDQLNIQKLMSRIDKKSVEMRKLQGKIIVLEQFQNEKLAERARAVAMKNSILVLQLANEIDVIEQCFPSLQKELGRLRAAKTKSEGKLHTLIFPVH